MQSLLVAVMIVAIEAQRGTLHKILAVKQ